MNLGLSYLLSSLPTVSLLYDLGRESSTIRLVISPVGREADIR